MTRVHQKLSSIYQNWMALKTHQYHVPITSILWTAFPPLLKRTAQAHHYLSMSGKTVKTVFSSLSFAAPTLSIP